MIILKVEDNVPSGDAHPTERLSIWHLAPGTCSINVLVVDDDVGIRETMEDILDELGVKHLVAKDGYEAITLARQHSVDLVLMDYRMPGLDGLQTSKLIHDIQPHAKIILVTAFANKDIIDDAKRLGLEDVLYKPLDLYHLIKIINSLMDVHVDV